MRSRLSLTLRSGTNVSAVKPVGSKWTAANDNPVREQEHFERCVERELAGSDEI